MAVRLAGIYALLGAARASDAYRGSVKAAMCAYVHERTIGMPYTTEFGVLTLDLDLQTALDLIGDDEQLNPTATPKLFKDDYGEQILRREKQRACWGKS
jgi:hypothetical protein